MSTHLAVERDDTPLLGSAQPSQEAGLTKQSLSPLQEAPLHPPGTSPSDAVTGGGFRRSAPSSPSSHSIAGGAPEKALQPADTAVMLLAMQQNARINNNNAALQMMRLDPNAPPCVLAPPYVVAPPCAVSESATPQQQLEEQRAALVQLQQQSQIRQQEMLQYQLQLQQQQQQQQALAYAYPVVPVPPPRTPGRERGGEAGQLSRKSRKYHHFSGGTSTGAGTTSSCSSPKECPPLGTPGGVCQLSGEYCVSSSATVDNGSSNSLTNSDLLSFSSTINSAERELVLEHLLAQAKRKQQRYLEKQKRKRHQSSSSSKQRHHSSGSRTSSSGKKKKNRSNSSKKKKSKSGERLRSSASRGEASSGSRSRKGEGRCRLPTPPGLPTACDSSVLSAIMNEEEDEEWQGQKKEWLAELKAMQKQFLEQQELIAKLRQQREQQEEEDSTLLSSASVLYEAEKAAAIASVAHLLPKKSAATPVVEEASRPALSDASPIATSALHEVQPITTAGVVAKDAEEPTAPPPRSPSNASPAPAPSVGVADKTAQKKQKKAHNAESAVVPEEPKGPSASSSVPQVSGEALQQQINRSIEFGSVVGNSAQESRAVVPPQAAQEDASKASKKKKKKRHLVEGGGTEEASPPKPASISAQPLASATLSTSEENVPDIQKSRSDNSHDRSSNNNNSNNSGSAAQVAGVKTSKQITATSTMNNSRKPIVTNAVGIVSSSRQISSSSSSGNDAATTITTTSEQNRKKDNNNNNNSSKTVDHRHVKPNAAAVPTPSVGVADKTAQKKQKKAHNAESAVVPEERKGPSASSSVPQVSGEALQQQINRSIVPLSAASSGATPISPPSLGKSLSRQQRLSAAAAAVVPVVPEVHDWIDSMTPPSTSDSATTIDSTAVTGGQQVESSAVVVQRIPLSQAGAEEEEEAPPPRVTETRDGHSSLQRSAAGHPAGSRQKESQRRREKTRERSCTNTKNHNTATTDNNNSNSEVHGERASSATQAVGNTKTHNQKAEKKQQQVKKTSSVSGATNNCEGSNDNDNNNNRRPADDQRMKMNPAGISREGAATHPHRMARPGAGGEAGRGAVPVLQPLEIPPPGSPPSSPAHHAHRAVHLQPGSPPTSLTRASGSLTGAGVKLSPITTTAAASGGVAPLSPHTSSLEGRRVSTGGSGSATEVIVERMPPGAGAVSSISKPAVWIFPPDFVVELEEKMRAASASGIGSRPRSSPLSSSARQIPTTTVTSARFSASAGSPPITPSGGVGGGEGTGWGPAAAASSYRGQDNSSNDDSFSAAGGGGGGMADKWAAVGGENHSGTPPPRDVSPFGKPQQQQQQFVFDGSASAGGARIQAGKSRRSKKGHTQPARPGLQRVREETKKINWGY